MNAPTPFPQTVRPQFVGRAFEKDHFRDLVSESLRGERPSPTLWRGAPGFGKSTLRMEFERLLRDMRMGDKDEGQQPVMVAQATVQVEFSQTVTDQLVSLRTQLSQGTGFQFITFDWAFVRWFKLAHPDADIAQRHPNMFRASGGAADDICSWINDIAKDDLVDAVHDSLSLVPGLNLLVKYGTKLKGAVGEWMQKNKFSGELEHIESLSEEELKEFLPQLLGHNLEMALEACRKKGQAGAVVMIDGAEKLVSSQDFQGANDAWIESFAKYTPSTSLNIFSRSRKHVDDFDELDFDLIIVDAFDEETFDAYLAHNQMPEACRRELIGFSQGVPLATRVGLNLYQEHLAGLAVDEEEQRQRFVELLNAKGYDQVFAHVTRDMNVAAVKEMTFLCCLEDLTLDRISKFGDKVFGSGANVDVSRMFRMGMLHLTDTEPRRYEIHDIWRQTFLRSDRHYLARTEIEERIARAFIAECTSKALEDEDAAKEIVADVGRAMGLLGSWRERDFEPWHQAIKAMIRAGYTRTARHYAGLVVNHTKKRFGDLLTEDIMNGAVDPRHGLLLEWSMTCHAEAAIDHGNYAGAAEFYGSRVMARNIRGLASAEDCWKAARWMLAAGNEREFAHYLEMGFDVIYQILEKKFSYLLDVFEIPLHGKTNYYALLKGESREHFEDFIDSREKSGVDRWVIVHQRIEDMHNTFQFSVTDLCYTQSKRIFDTICECRKMIQSALRELYYIPGEIVSYQVGGAHLEGVMDAIEKSFAILSGKDFDPGESWKAIRTLTEGWSNLSESDLRERAKGLSNARLASLSDEHTFGYLCNEVLRLMRLRVADGEFKMAANNGLSFEKFASKTGYIQQPEPNHMALAEIYGLLGMSLHKLGMDSGLVAEKLRFAYQQFILGSERSFKTEEEVAKLFHWLQNDVFAPTGYKMSMREAEEGEGPTFEIVALNDASV